MWVHTIDWLHAHQKIKMPKRNAEEISFISISFLRAFSSPIDRLFCQSQKHIIMHKKTDFCYRMNSIPFMIDSTNILYYGLSSLISYFNHDRLIALCFLWLVIRKPQHAPCVTLIQMNFYFVDPALNRTWIELRGVLTDMHI